MFRDICGGSKGATTSTYDPNISAAASRSAEIADRAEQFSETFYKNVVTPLLEQQSKSSLESQGKLGKLYDLNAEQMQLAGDRYKQYGIPAEENYYKMAQQYSEPQEMERQAEAAKGDFQTAAASQQQQLMRQYASLGIDPTSGAAQSVMGNNAIMGAAMQAAAMNRARNGARQLGMQLTADAANFGRGGQSGILQFGAGAQGNATGAFGMANAALGTGMQAGNGVLQGYKVAADSYGNTMDAYSRMGSAQIQANAQANSAGMAGLGQLAGMGMQFIPGFGLSDIRTKQDLQPIGSLPSGATLYRFQYKPEFRDRWGHGTQVGVVAQEIMARQPDAVSVGADGYYVVDYRKVR